MSYAQIKSKAAAAFEKIGRQNGTSSPSSLDNRSTIAHEYFIADTLASIASKRKDEAKKAAMSAGILLDEGIEGNTVQTYENEHLTISAKTNQAAERLDKQKLTVELLKAVGAEKAEAIIKAASVKSKPATSYIFSVK